MSGPKRGPGVSQAMHDRTVAAFTARQEAAQAAKDAEAAEVSARLAGASARGLHTTAAAIRAAIGQQRTEDAAAERSRQLAAARIVVGSSGALGIDDVRRWGEALRGPDGSRPTQELVAEKLDCSPRWISAICKPHGGYRAVLPDRKS